MNKKSFFVRCVTFILLISFLISGYDNAILQSIQNSKNNVNYALALRSVFRDTSLSLDEEKQFEKTLNEILQKKSKEIEEFPERVIETLNIMSKVMSLEYPFSIILTNILLYEKNFALVLDEIGETKNAKYLIKKIMPQENNIQNLMDFILDIGIKDENKTSVEEKNLLKKSEIKLALAFACLALQKDDMKRAKSLYKEAIELQIFEGVEGIDAEEEIKEQVKNYNVKEKFKKIEDDIHRIKLEQINKRLEDIIYKKQYSEIEKIFKLYPKESVEALNRLDNAINYALSKKDWKAFGILLAHRIPDSYEYIKRNLEMYIQLHPDAVQQFGINNQFSNESNFFKYIYGCNFGIFKHGELVKAVAHLLDFKGRSGQSQDMEQEDYLFFFKRDRKMSLEGWYIKDFLPLHIFSLTQIWYNTWLNISQKPYLNTTKITKMQELLKWLTREIVYALNMYKDVQVFNSSVGEGVDQKQEKSNLETLAKYISRNITSLPNGDRYIVSTGFRGHAIYVEFLVLNEQVYIRIDNLGAGAEKHISDNNNSQKKYPYSYCPISVLRGQNIRTYINGILIAKNQEERDAYKNIYCSNEIFQKVPILYSKSGPKKTQYPDSYPKELQYPAQYIQTVGNCSVYNYVAGMQLRGGQFFDDVIEKETAILAELCRKKSQNQGLEARATLVARTEHFDSVMVEITHEKMNEYLEQQVVYKEDNDLYVDVNVENAENINTYVNNFLQNKNNKNEKVLAIFGDSGSGKSMYAWQLINRLWNERKSNDSLPIPVWYPFKNIPKKELSKYPYFILRQYGLSDIEIDYLKNTRKIVFILDGYDEAKDQINISGPIRDWRNAQLIVTCRSQYKTKAGDEDYRRLWFSEDEDLNSYHEIEISSFGKQIDKYLEKYAKKNPSKTEAEYKLEINKFRSIIKTPLMLKMVLEVLPDLLKEKDKDIKQVDIYDLIIKKWGQNEQKRLVASTSSDFIKHYEEYSKKLACELFEKESSELSPEEQYIFDQKIDQDQRFFNMDTVNRVRWGCLLKENKTEKLYQVKFEHSSFQEYFASRAIYDDLVSDSKNSLPMFIEICKKNLISKLLLKDQLGIVNFLVERIVVKSMEAQSFKNNLLKIIEYSAKNPEDKEMKTAAYNAKEILRMRARNLYNSEDKKTYAESIALYDAMLNADPNYAGAHVSLGMVYSKEGNKKCAVEHYDMAKSLFAKNPKGQEEEKKSLAVASHNEGTTYLTMASRSKNESEKKKCYDMVIKNYENALEVNPDFGMNWNGNGVMFFFPRAGKDMDISEYLVELGVIENKYIRKKYEDIQKYLQTIPDNNKSLVVWYGIGAVNEVLGNLGEAEIAYQRANELYKQKNNNKNFVWATTRITMIHFKQKKYDEVIKECETAFVDSGRKFVFALYIKALALDAIGKYEKALEIYSEIIKKQPRGFKWAEYNRAVDLCKLGRYQDAILGFEKAIKMSGNDKNIMAHIGKALAYLGEFQQSGLNRNFYSQEILKELHESQDILMKLSNDNKDKDMGIIVSQFRIVVNNLIDKFNQHEKINTENIFSFLDAILQGRILKLELQIKEERIMVRVIKSVFDILSHPMAKMIDAQYKNIPISIKNIEEIFHAV
jgi:tetratricopeptide (TPR) repeat protein